MSGFRCGVVVTQSIEVIEGLKRLIYFFSESTQTVWTLIKFLTDRGKELRYVRGC